MMQHKESSVGGSLKSQLDVRPMVMGVVNVTPDSFSDGGKFINADNAIEHGLHLIQEGADILDIGGESTRPGAQAVDIDEEIDRVVPVIQGLKACGVEWVSIDTRNAKTMQAAIDAGANIINDISALTHDGASLDVAANARVPIILMHSQGVPQSMQKNPNYNNVVDDVFSYFEDRLAICRTRRIDDDLLILDPGIGFGKTLEHNLLLLRNIRKFQDFGMPILLGTSRKSFIAAICNGEPPIDRIPGSLASALWGLSQGAKIFRVHDVKETKQALDVFQAISSY